MQYDENGHGDHKFQVFCFVADTQHGNKFAECAACRTEQKERALRDTPLLFLCAAAVFPGLSRSGSTMAAGLLRGINQQAALDYSFVLGIPSILAAAVLTIKDAIGQPVDIGVGAMIAGVVTAAVVGFLAIKLLKWIVTTNKLQVFAYYTLVLGVITLIVSVIEAVTGTNLFTGMPL